MIAELKRSIFGTEAEMKTEFENRVKISWFIWILFLF
jgi:hypothetical protein